MPINITMPALSPTMEEGNLSKWLVKEGDKVSPGDVIAEIETDKATMEVEAIDEGTLGKILVPEGTNDVAVNTPIATILSEGEDASAAFGCGTGAAGALARSAALSPSARMVAIGVLTATSAVPSGIRIWPSVPSSVASTSMVALSVSISAMTSPDLMVSPSFFSHLARLPFSMVGDSAGMST